MPSFPTVGGVYQYYLTDNLDADEREHLTSNDGRNSLKYIRKFNIITITIVLCISMILVYPAFDDYLYYHHHTWYLSNYIPICWWSYHLLSFLYLNGFIFAILTTVISSKHYININIATQKHLVSVFLIVILIFGIQLTSVSILGFVYTDNGYASIFDTKSSGCRKFIECQDWTPIFLLFDIIYPSSFVWAIIIYFIYIKIKNMIKTKPSNNNADHLEIALLDINDKIDESQDIRHGIKANGFWYALLFGLLFGLLGLFNWFFNTIHHTFYNEQFEIVYLIMFIGVNVFQFSLKRIGRICDRIRINKFAKCNGSLPYKYISLEYFSQFYTSMLYYVWYRYLIIYHTPSMKLYILTLILHFMMETIRSSARFTNIYYDRIRVCLECESQSDDMSNWRVRLSMDLVIRFLTSMLSGIGVLIDITMIGEHAIQTKFGSKSAYSYIMSYIVASIILELIHYVTIFIAHFFLHQFNIIVPFVYYIKYMTRANKISIMVLCCCVFVVTQVYFVST